MVVEAGVVMAGVLLVIGGWHAGSQWFPADVPDVVPAPDHCPVATMPERVTAGMVTTMDAPAELTPAGEELPWKLRKGETEDLREPAADALVSALVLAIKDQDGAALTWCRAQLRSLGVDAVEYLTPLIMCGTPAIEIEALRILTQIGTREALVLVVTRVLAVDPDTPDYPAYLAVIQDVHSVEVVQLLTDRLGREASAVLRERVLALLDVMRGPEVAAVLADAIAHDPYGATRSAYLQAVEGRQDPSEVAVLSDVLVTTTDDALAESAAYGLASIGNNKACVTLADRAEREAVKIGPSINALASVHSSYGQQGLMAIASDESRPADVRVASIEALGSQGGPYVLAVLANLGLQADDARVAAEAAQAHDILQDGSKDESLHAVTIPGGEVCY